MSGQIESPVDVVSNYDDVWIYEPRQFRILDIELWNRGVPRAPLIYGFLGTLLLLLLSVLPVIGAPLGVLPIQPRVLVCAGLAGLFSWWAWKLPPGGVVPHRAAAGVWRGLQAPKRLYGWVPAGRTAQQWRPAPLPMEPDGRERHVPALRYTGPGRVVRYRGAEQQLHEQGLGARLAGRRTPARTVSFGPKWRSEPEILTLAAGETFEFREGDDA